MSDGWEKTAPLSYQQERMYLFEGLDSGSSVNNVACIHWIDGEPDRSALAAAVTELHRRHEILRTRYPGATVQAVAPPADVPIRYTDLRDHADPTDDVVGLVDAAVNRPFDLAAAPPVAWSLYRLETDRYALVLLVHHIVFDAWSKAIINRELSTLYADYLAGRPVSLPEPTTQYPDYAARQRCAPPPPVEAWAESLAGAPCVALPFDRQPDADTGFAGRAARTPMRDKLIRQAEQLARQERSSLFMVLLAAFAGLLSGHDGQRDLVIGVPTAGRADLDTEHLIGCFVDTVPFRINLAGRTTFRELLAHVRDVTLDTQDLPHVPLARLVAATRPERQPGREPLVQVVFQLLNAPTEQLRLTGLTVLEEVREPASIGLDLTVTVADGTEGPIGLWQYKTELFDDTTIAALQRDFEHVVERVVADPDTPLAELVESRGGTPATGPAASPSGTGRHTGVERMVARIWTEILAVADVGPQDNFFDLGGHSLTAGQVVARIAELVPGLSTRGLLRDVLRHPVLARFAAVLAERMAQAGTASPTAPLQRIPVVDRDGPLTLSLGQRRLWFLDQFVAHSAEYFVPMAMRVTGELDVPALDAALREIVDRHEALRTSIEVVDDEPVGRVRSAAEFVLDQSTVDGADLDGVVAAEGFRPLDLAHGLPIRATLLRLGPADHVLCLTIHHIVFDGWSHGIFFDELETLYGEFAAGRPSPLAPLTVQYADVAAYQQAHQDTPEFATKLDFWRTELAGSTPFELPGDLPRPARRTAPGQLRVFTVPAAVTKRLERIATEHDATLFMALLTSWQTLLHRYTGAEDITLGTTAAEREITESESLIGLFINMLVLRGDLSGVPSFADLLARTRDRTLDAYANQDVPFDRLVAEFAGERDLSRTPIFQIMVKLSNVRQRGAVLPGLAVEPVAGRPIPAKYDMEIDFVQRDGGLTVELRYDTGLYLPATIDGLIAHFTALLAAITDDPDTPINRLNLMDAAEQRRVADLTARPVVDFPARCLHQLVEDQVRRTPDAVAVIEDGRALTYAELDGWANRIATLLRAHGAGPDVVIGVLLDRSAEMVAALLGVLKAGSAYLPIETDTPPSRIAQLLTDGNAPACLTVEALATTVADTGCVPLAVPPAGPGRAPDVDVHPGNLVAVYYTSGSTGKPKGVACTHEGWVNRMCWMRRHHPLRPGETVLHKTTLTFDDAAVEIFWPLLVGGRVALLGPGLHRDPRAIADAAIRWRAVHVQFVPSVLDLFLETLTDADIERLGALRSVLSSGEALRPALVRRFTDRFGSRVMLDNTWGATEVSIDSTCRVCEPHDGLGDGGAVCIGVPIDNNDVLVLDRGCEPVPVGVSGELCIGGVGLARGYLGDPKRTAEVFTPHPFRPGERIYRTGDWGRLGSDGALTFHSRRDDQVKVRGVRVELGEVEHALRVHPAVADAAVIAWEAAPGDKRLAAYAVLKSDVDCTATQIVSHARDLLPGYAVPTSIQIVAALPRHTNGKLDRRGLPAPDTRGTQAEVPTAPRTTAERIVTEIWADVLGVPDLGVDDDFFAAGGHSLLATRAIGRMRQAFTPALPLTLMFECPTPARAAAMVEEILLAEIAELTDEQARQLLAQP